MFAQSHVAALVILIGHFYALVLLMELCAVILRKSATEINYHCS